jgi:hypothetical protein
MPNSVRHAVFLEPTGALHDAVLARKELTARTWPGATFVNHPPHCTLWVGTLRDAEAAQHAVQNAVARMTDWPSVDQLPAHVFFDDQLAGGGQTCVLALPVTAALIALQGIVADALAPHISQPADEELPAGLRHSPYRESWRRYGFPFVGAHWLPHFTIASLPVERTDDSITQFLNEPPLHVHSTCDLSFWKVDGERHERCAWLRSASTTTAVTPR